VATTTTVDLAFSTGREKVMFKFVREEGSSTNRRVLVAVLTVSKSSE